jgi:hypothetical protein
MKKKEKKYLYLLIICAIISNALFAQEERYYFADNIFHEIYRKYRVKSWIAFDDEYEKGMVVNTSSSFEAHFDEKGNLIAEIESYGINDLCSDTLSYEYDEEHRHKKFSWNWKCPSRVEVVTYEYNNEGKLVKYCDLSSKESLDSIELDSCVMINYLNGKMTSETTMTGELIKQFIHTNGKVLVKSKGGELESVYENENHIETHHLNHIYYRTFNDIHQILTAKKVDMQGNLIRITKYKYQNDLLIESITLDDKEEVISGIRFEYTYFE